MRLTEKYRPQTFEAVLGQEKVVASLKATLEKDGKLPSAIIFSGTSGRGKTTLARVCGEVIGCTKDNLVELNAIRKNSKEDMEAIIDLDRFIPFGKNKTRIFILDEAHMLSKAAWNVLLKPVEEPAPNTTWIFCTTELNKIPDSIKTRCAIFEIGGVPSSKIQKLLEHVVKEEGFTIDKQILMFISMNSDKSPRRALKYLEMLHAETSLQKAKELISSAQTEEELPVVLALGRLIMNGGSFLEALAASKNCEEDLEGVRLGILKYFSTVCIRSKSIEDSKKALYVLNAFSKNWNPAEKLAPLLLALAEILISE